MVVFAAPPSSAASRPNVEQLVAARALQGVGRALLTPGSLALIQSSFLLRGPGEGHRVVVSRSPGIAGLIGPFLGGVLVDTVSWRRSS